jgi:hypothetical protein
MVIYLMFLPGCLLLERQLDAQHMFDLWWPWTVTLLHTLIFSFLLRASMFEQSHMCL